MSPTLMAFFCFGLCLIKKMESNTGYLPKPSLLARPSSMVSPEQNVTLWCWRPPQADLQEVNFTLFKMGYLNPLQHKVSAESQVAFSLLSVSSEDARIYTCSYSDTESFGMMSKPSNALELLITGSLPKPLLSALPGPVLIQGRHLMLQCQQPTWSFLWDLTFALFKAGVPEPLQQQRPGGTRASFPILVVRTQDSGNYSCIYYYSMMPQQKTSEVSDPLEILVTDLRIHSHDEQHQGKRRVKSCQRDHLVEKHQNKRKNATWKD
ncbi:T-cell-interacting, activating receptor on myeloid cells protein 1-like isoform X2 [Macrotis lagotis]|uniref:T-cell-interacting, activating receptor on myeloid cells protein 1-like isoform X2 n=1 Tax=Macrotis lagotis TaxID=92651 RepID=UPI003D698E86